MKKQDIINLFPLKGIVTQDIIDNADVNNIYQCIGAKTLKAALPEELHHKVTWGIREGFVYTGDTPGCYMERIAISSGIGMMSITEPREVTFTFMHVDYEKSI